MTLIVNGTCASELRTRFWPMRFTYSVTTGSRTSFEVASTSWAYCLPMRISPSSEYQSPSPRPPTFRLPIAFTSFLLPSCLTLLSSGCTTTEGGAPAALSPGLASDAFASGAVEGGFCVAVEESCPLVWLSLGFEPSVVLLFVVGLGAEPEFGSCSWAIAEGSPSNAETATAAKTRRYFI